MTQLMDNSVSILRESKMKYVYAEETGHEESLNSITLVGAKAEACDLLRTGDWGDSLSENQRSIRPTAKIIAEYTDDEGDTKREIVEAVTVQIDPVEPDCIDTNGHNWRSPHSVVGGLEENPGVWGRAGGVIIYKVCAYCGVYQVTETKDGPQGLGRIETVRYDQADEYSRAYVDSQSTIEQ